MIREIDWRSDLAPEDSTPFRFTGQELDAETGLYYFGARYLDPRTSRWLSVDPAMGEYAPASGQEVSDLPGIGFDKLGSNLNRILNPPMRSMLDPPPPTPGVALERALAEDRTALTSGRFSQEAMSIAGRRLNKYGREARAWVNEETSRFEALLNIRDTEGREEIESMMNEAEAAFNEAHDRTNFVTDPSGRRRPASEQDRNNAREVAANAVIDNFIRSKMPDE